eukprot:gene24104-biopygen7374
MPGVNPWEFDPPGYTSRAAPGRRATRRSAVAAVRAVADAGGGDGVRRGTVPCFRWGIWVAKYVSPLGARRFEPGQTANAP